jgi:putative membrane protein
MNRKIDRSNIIQLLIFSAACIWSVINPRDMVTWIMEAAPALAALIILMLTYKKFRFTRLVYWCILIHCIILLIGAHYTYARVPLFDYLKDALDLSRNNYDKVGHLAQGFIPALVARELLIRTSPLRPGKWLFWIVTCICLAISAFYEIIEWWAALAFGRSAESFLGTQGYVWDTQSDMLMALIGAILAQILLSSYHDKKISEIHNG